MSSLGLWAPGIKALIPAFQTVVGAVAVVVVVMQTRKY